MPHGSGPGQRIHTRLAALCVVAIAAWLGCREAAPPQAPEEAAIAASSIEIPGISPVRNVVLICLDTVRFDVFQALDEVGDDPFAVWSERALRFERAQSTAPWTIPAVASALTGRQPQRHGAGRFPESIANLDTTAPSALPVDVPSLPDLLLQRGFATRAFVAHAWFRSKFGLARGLEVVDYHPNDAEMLRRALAWLEGPEAVGPDPFLLYLHFMRPHSHLDWSDGEVRKRRARLTPAERAAVLELESMPICESAQSAACTRFVAYAESIARIRRQLTWLMAVLEKRGRLRDTVVVLFADHGEEFLDHAPAQRALQVDPRGIYGHGHGQSLYQELVHVPLMIWHPRLEGGRTALPASLVDIAPSVMDWLGLDVSGIDFDGESLGPLIESESENAARALYSTGISFGPEQLAVVRGDWKRVLHRASQERQLFQLRDDPHEREPVDDARMADELDRLLDAYASRASRPSGGEAPELSEEELRALQDLGYLREASGP